MGPQVGDKVFFVDHGGVQSLAMIVHVISDTQVNLVVFPAWGGMEHWNQVDRRVPLTYTYITWDTLPVPGI